MSFNLIDNLLKYVMNLSINWTKSSVYTWLIRGWGQMKKGNPNFIGSTYFFLSSKQVNEINQNYLRPHFDRQPCKNPFFISIIINKTFVGVGSRTKIKYKVIHTYIYFYAFFLLLIKIILLELKRFDTDDDDLIQ